MKNLVRGVVASTALCAALVLAACGDGGADRSEGGTTSAPAVEVEEELATVDVRVARSLLDPDGTLTDQEIVSAAGEKAMTAVIEGDTVIYTMARQQRDEMLAQMRASAQDAVDDMIADDSNSITGIDIDNAMTSFQVSVDSARFSPMESLLVLAFYIQGALYQQFAGVPQDDIDVTVDFVDNVTGEVLESGSYQEMRQNLEQ